MGKTEGVRFRYTIESPDIKTNEYTDDGKIAHTAKYEISVWASADGYTNSEKATATLYFIDGKLESETGFAQVPALRGIVVAKNDSDLSISGLNNGETVEAFNLQGMKIGQATAVDGTAVIPSSNIDKAAIIKVGKESIKVAM